MYVYAHVSGTVEAMPIKHIIILRLPTRKRLIYIYIYLGQRFKNICERERNNHIQHIARILFVIVYTLYIRATKSQKCFSPLTKQFFCWRLCHSFFDCSFVLHEFCEFRYCALSTCMLTYHIFTRPQSNFFFLILNRNNSNSTPRQRQSALVCFKRSVCICDVTVIDECRSQE